MISERLKNLGEWSCHFFDTCNTCDRATPRATSARRSCTTTVWRCGTRSASDSTSLARRRAAPTLPAEPGEVATEQRATLATWAAGALTPVAQLDHP